MRGKKVMTEIKKNNFTRLLLVWLWVWVWVELSWVARHPTADDVSLCVDYCQCTFVCFSNEYSTLGDTKSTTRDLTQFPIFPFVYLYLCSCVCVFGIFNHFSIQTDLSMVLLFDRTRKIHFKSLQENKKKKSKKTDFQVDRYWHLTNLKSFSFNRFSLIPRLRVQVKSKTLLFCVFFLAFYIYVLYSYCVTSTYKNKHRESIHMSLDTDGWIFSLYWGGAVEKWKKEIK